MLQDFSNKLKKNLQKYQRQLKNKNIDSFRVYNWDIPNFPLYLDKYKDVYIAYDCTHDKKDPEDLFLRMTETIRETLQIEANNLILKRRERQKGKSQYEKNSRFEEREFIVQEGPAKLLIRPSLYLDVGLFLDHRPLRLKLSQRSVKNKNLLNLFSYTSSMGVHGALGGYETLNVDLSNTYLDWSEENYRLNNLSLNDHGFIKADILDWIDHNNEDKFDLIILDPPSFSNSKTMKDYFDVQENHASLIKSTMKLLKPNGELYFSCNLKSFKLDESLPPSKDLTGQSIPIDFKNRKIHHCFLFENK